MVEKGALPGSSRKPCRGVSRGGCLGLGGGGGCGFGVWGVGGGGGPPPGCFFGKGCGGLWGRPGGGGVCFFFFSLWWLGRTPGSGVCFAPLDPKLFILTGLMFLTLWDFVLGGGGLFECFPWFAFRARIRIDLHIEGPFMRGDLPRARRKKEKSRRKQPIRVVSISQWRRTFLQLKGEGEKSGGLRLL